MTSLWHQLIVWQNTDTLRSVITTISLHTSLKTHDQHLRHHSIYVIIRFTVSGLVDSSPHPSKLSWNRTFHWTTTILILLLWNYISHWSSLSITPWSLMTLPCDDQALVNNPLWGCTHVQILKVAVREGSIGLRCNQTNPHSFRRVYIFIIVRWLWSKEGP